jgi:hypothetical protein
MNKKLMIAGALALGLAGAALAQAQMNHGNHGMMGGMSGSEGVASPDMDRMSQMMRDMATMMDRMRTASPAERAEMMQRMQPMMREMMPMMQGMMGGMTPGGDDQHQHQHGGADAAAAPSTRAFEEANAKMHRDMAIAFTGNADVDFVRGMIPHHQGAIDMARVVLQYGRDEQVKKWADDIIAAQEREIAEMRAWLEKNAQ